MTLTIDTYILRVKVIGTSVSQYSGGRLATTLVATIDAISPTFFFSVIYFSQRRSARIKKLILRKLIVGVGPKNLGVCIFPDPSAILWPPNGHFGFCRRCGIAGGERVPLGWYYLFKVLSNFINFWFSSKN